MMSKMRVAVLVGEQASQIALCHKLAEHCDLVSIILSKNIPRKPKPFLQRAKLLLNRFEVRVAGHPLVNAWLLMQSRYTQSYSLPSNVPVIRVSNVNDGVVIERIEASGADLVAVSGTNLIGHKVIESSLRKSGIVNLHTGISPYVKGGPNCTNWCLARRWFHLIGNSILWLNQGIDSGPIIATEQTPLTGNESLPDLHWKVMQHAHEMYVAVVEAIAAGRQLRRISQSSIAEGRTFLSSEWDGLQAATAWRNYSRYFDPSLIRSSAFRQLSAELKLFPRSSWLANST